MRSTHLPQQTLNQSRLERRRTLADPQGAVLSLAPREHFPLRVESEGGARAAAYMREVRASKVLDRLWNDDGKGDEKPREGEGAS